MNLARRVFFWSGIYGIVVLLPMYFLEAKLGRDFPPATNHPEHYYAFLGIALAWQFAFLLIARDVVRYRALMLPAMAEKFLAGGAAVWLLVAGRVAFQAVAPFFLDLVLGVLFVLSYVRTGGSPAASADS